jgi:hypothetical protein
MAAIVAVPTMVSMAIFQPFAGLDLVDAVDFAVTIVTTAVRRVAV